MTLYHPNGAAHSLDPSLWRFALELARAHGWRPAGTLAPPATLNTGQDPEWQGAYDAPLEQEVMRPDAAALGHALARGLRSLGDAADQSGIKRLAEFCHEGGFIACPAREAADSLLELARTLTAEPSRASLHGAACRR